MQRNYTIVLTAALILAFALIPGCSDRGNNPAPEYIHDSGPLLRTHVFFDELTVQIKNDQFQQKFLRGWVPKISEWGIPPTYNPTDPVPLLVLLPPQDGDRSYYQQHGLTEIADQLIAEGLIEPMIIVSINNDPIFGGYWWSGNGGGSGNYDTLIGGTMIDFIYGPAGLLLPEAWDGRPEMTAIGGVGTGGYGALRAAMLHPGRFGSVSAVDAPLMFEGDPTDPNDGLLTLFETALIEQNLTGNPNYINEWDSSSAYNVSNLLMGGALAFSPQDTLVKPVVQILGGSGELDISAPDSIIASIDSSVSPYDTTWEQRRFKLAGDTLGIDTIEIDVDTTVTPPDTTFDTVWNVGAALVDHIVQEDAYNFDFYLPFDENGDPHSTPNEPIWDLWLRNSADSLFINNAGALFGTRIFLGWSTDDDPRDFNVMTQSFADFLESQGINPATFTYSGFEGNPAIGDEYVNYVLREMLIFHSKAFKSLGGN